MIMLAVSRPFLPPPAATGARLRTWRLRVEAAQLAASCSLQCVLGHHLTSNYRHVALQVLWGQPTISQELGGLRFDISACSFFQTNSTQAAQLVHMVVQAAGAGVRSHPVRAR